MEPDPTFQPNAPASAEALASLKTGMVKSLPETYFAFLMRANGGEGFIGDRYVQLWRAEELADMNRAYNTAEFFPNLFSSEVMAAGKPTLSISRARRQQYSRFHLLACRPMQGQSQVPSIHFLGAAIRVNERNRLIAEIWRAFRYSSHLLVGVLKVKQLTAPRGLNQQMPLLRSRNVKLIETADLNAFSCIMAIVVFLVLAYWMTTTSYHHDGGTIELPRVLHTVPEGSLTWGANRHDAMIIAVTRNGDIFMNKDLVSDSMLIERIHESLKQGAEPKVYIRADAMTRYSRVKAVLDAVRSNGVKDVAFIADQRNRPYTFVDAP